MSIQIVATLTCDGCGAVMVGEPQYKTTGMVTYWDLKHAARIAGWLTLNRGRYHVPTHYCPECADKPMKPVPRKGRV